MTLIVNQLETFDQKNLEVIRLEFLKLQRKLEECQEETGYFKPEIGELPDCGQDEHVNRSNLFFL